MTTLALPADLSLEAYRAYRKDVATWLSLLTELAGALGLPTPLEPILQGSNLIAAAGPEVILKVYAPPFATDFAIERAGLRAAHGRLGVATSEILAEGTHHGWPYLVLRRLPGVMLEAVWPSLTEADKLRLATQLGEVTARLHALPAAELAALRPAWPDFVRGQAARAMATHREAGASDAWLAALAEFLEQSESEASRAVSPVLLHADLTDHNVLAAERDGVWHLSGLLDFADATVGAPEYELMPACLGGLNGEHALQRPYLLAAGFDPEGDEAGLRRRAMLHTVLHRFSHLPGMMKRARVGPEVTTFEALERAMWPL